MQNKLVKDVMGKDFDKIDEDETLITCINNFKKQRTPVSIVVDARGNYRGIIAKRLILRSDFDESTTKIKKLTKSAPILNEEDTIVRAAQLMLENNVRLLPVLVEDKLRGAVSDEDIIHEAVLGGWGKNKITSILTEDPEMVEKNQTIGEVMTMFRQYDISHAPIVDKGKLVGIVSLRDIQVFLTQPRERQTRGDRKGEKERMTGFEIHKVMTSPVITITPSAKLKDAEQIMHDNNIESLIVVHEEIDDKVVGIVTKQDFLQPIANSVSKSQMITVQFMPRDVKITTDIRDKMLKRFEEFRKKVEKIIIPNLEQRANLKIIFKSVGQTTKKGDRRIHCDMQLFSHLDLFNIKNEGFGIFDVFQECMAELERRIKKKISKTRKYK